MAAIDADRDFAADGGAAYNISKGGVDHMVRTLAVEWGGRNIRVNAFNPGYLEHAMTLSEEYDSDPKIEETIQLMTPLRRRGRSRRPSASRCSWLRTPHPS